MTRTVRRSLLFTGSTLLLLSGMWSSGCIDATAPTTPPASQGIAMPQSTSALGQAAGVVTQLFVYASTKPTSYLAPNRVYVHAARGGVVSAGQFTVTIPPNALPQSTYITVAPSSLTQVQVALEPTGLQFRPGYNATLTFDYGGTTGESSPVMVSAWFNPSLSRWESLPNGVRNTQAKRYSVPLEHFSYYALAK